MKLSKMIEELTFLREKCPDVDPEVVIINDNETYDFNPMITLVNRQCDHEDDDVSPDTLMDSITEPGTSVVIVIDVDCKPAD